MTNRPANAKPGPTETASGAKETNEMNPESSPIPSSGSAGAVQPTELLSCPFCGGGAEISLHDGDAATWIARCRNEGCTAWPSTDCLPYGDAVAAWNCRATPPAAGEAREASPDLLKEAVAIMDALMLKADVRQDRNSEFFAVAQWKIKANGGQAYAQPLAILAEGAAYEASLATSPPREAALSDAVEVLRELQELSASMKHSAGTWMVPGWDGWKVADLLDRARSIVSSAPAPAGSAEGVALPDGSQR